MDAEILTKLREKATMLARHDQGEVQTDDFQAASWRLELVEAVPALLAEVERLTATQRALLGPVEDVDVAEVLAVDTQSQTPHPDGTLPVNRPALLASLGKFAPALAREVVRLRAASVSAHYKHEAEQQRLRANAQSRLLSAWRPVLQAVGQIIGETVNPKTYEEGTAIGARLIVMVKSIKKAAARVAFDLRPARRLECTWGNGQAIEPPEARFIFLPEGGGFQLKNLFLWSAATEDDKTYYPTAQTRYELDTTKGPARFYTAMPLAEFSAVVAGTGKT
jgi:hypothetical protein